MFVRLLSNFNEISAEIVNILNEFVTDKENWLNGTQQFIIGGRKKITRQRHFQWDWKLQ